MALVPEGGRRGGLARFAMVLQGCGPTNLQPGASHQGILASLPIPPKEATDKGLSHARVFADGLAIRR